MPRSWIMADTKTRALSDTDEVFKLRRPQNEQLPADPPLQ